MKREWEQRAQSDALGYIGRGYAENDELFWSSGETDLSQLILNGITIDPKASALEIGCGVGRLVRPLAQRVSQAAGVDIAPGMITRGRELLADLPNAQLHTTDGALDMLTDDSLDLVFSFVVFQHIPSKQAIIRYIQEAARVLKPGGVFKFQVDGRERPFWKGTDTWLGVWFKPSEIKQILVEAGFSLVDTWGEATQYYWLTTQLESNSLPATSLAKAHPPVWRDTGLRELLERLNQHSPDAMDAIKSGQRYLRDYTKSFQQSQTHTSPEEFVEAAFLTILNREIDQDGRNFYLKQLSEQATRSYIIDCLLSSAELRLLVRENPTTTPET